MVHPTPIRIVWRLTGRSSAKVLTEYAVLVVSGFKLAPRPGIFTVLGLNRMDVPLCIHYNVQEHKCLGLLETVYGNFL